jgi:hypothetical protein
MDVTSRKPRTPLLPMAIGLACVLGLAALFVALGCRSPVALDRQRWAGDAGYRQEVARPMAASGQLVGLDEQAVLLELGQPDKRYEASEFVKPRPGTRGVWWYALNFPGMAVTDTLNLVLVFGPSGRVTEAYVRHKW